MNEPDNLPQVYPAPDMRDPSQTVTRREGETDESYQSRVELYELLIKNAQTYGRMS